MHPHLRPFLLILLLGFIRVSGFQALAQENVTPTPNQSIYWFDWSDDGTRIAVATAYDIRVYDSSFQLLVSRPQPDPTGSRSFEALSPDGSKLTALREIWDTQTLQPLLHFDSIYSLGDWSKDGKLISTVGNDMRSIVLYDTTTGELVKTIPTGNLLTFNPVWSPDNTRFAITENNRTLAIIDASNGQIIAHYPHEELIDVAIAWSHDGKQIAYTGFLEPKPGTTGAEIKHSVFITNLMTGQTLRLASDLPSDIWDFDWSRDDTQLLAVGSTEVYIWDMKHSQLVERYNVLTLPIHAEFSPFSGQIMMGFNLYWYKSSTEFTVQDATRSFLDGAIQIAVPTASLEKLKSIIQACVLQPSIEEALIEQVNSNDLQAFASLVSSLTHSEIQEGCKADLLAVVNALMAKAA